MEEEARDILRRVMAESAPPPRNLAASIRARIAPGDRIDLDLPVREPMRQPKQLGKGRG